MSAISYWMALGYGSCGHKNVGIQLLFTTILITLTFTFTPPEPPIFPCFILFKLGPLPGRDFSILWYLDRAPTQWWIPPLKLFAHLSATWYNCMQRYQINCKELVCLCRAAAWGDAHLVWELDQPPRHCYGGTNTSFMVLAQPPLHKTSRSIVTSHGCLHRSVSNNYSKLFA